MPCGKCNSVRVITERGVLCPNCDNIMLLNIERVVERKTQELSLLAAEFSKELVSTDYNSTFGSAIVNRELAARAIHSLPTKRIHAVKEWLAYTYILRNLRHIKGKSNRRTNFPEILQLSRKIVQMINEIYCLRHGLSVLVKANNTEKIEWTEKEPLSFVPENVNSTSLLRLTRSKDYGREINIESAMVAERLSHYNNLNLEIIERLRTKPWVRTELSKLGSFDEILKLYVKNFFLLAN